MFERRKVISCIFGEFPVTHIQEIEDHEKSFSMLVSIDQKHFPVFPVFPVGVFISTFNFFYFLYFLCGLCCVLYENILYYSYLYTQKGIEV